MAKVEYTKENLDKCICPECPVQGESDCFKEGRKELKQVKEENSGELPDSKLLKKVGMYCAKAVGKTDCKDLDSDKACICASCPLWGENNLKSTYYCFEGDADQVD